MSFATPSVATLRSPLRVENLMPNTTVFTKQVNGDPLKVVFTAAGTPGAVQRVPLALAEDIDFLNSLDQGTLKVIDGPPEYVQALQVETGKVRAEREQAAKDAVSMLDRRQDRDIIGVTCVGPAPAGRSGMCGAQLLQSAAQSKKIPPLCEAHKSLAPNFYLSEAGSRGEEESGASETTAGEVRSQWREVTMTPPVKQ